MGARCRRQQQQHADGPLDAVVQGLGCGWISREIDVCAWVWVSIWWSVCICDYVHTYAKVLLFKAVHFVIFWGRIPCSHLDARNLAYAPLFFAFIVAEYIWTKMNAHGRSGLHQEGTAHT